MNGAAELTITVLLRIRKGITDHRDQRPTTSGVCSLRSGRVNFQARGGVNERTNVRAGERKNEEKRNRTRSLAVPSFKNKFPFEGSETRMGLYVVC